MRARRISPTSGIGRSATTARAFSCARQYMGRQSRTATESGCLYARLQPLMQVAKVARPGGYIEGDVYHSNRAALHESWSPLATAQGGKLIVATPETDTVLYVAEDTPTAIKA